MVTVLDESNKIPDHWKPGLAKANANRPLAHLDKVEVAQLAISRYLQGEKAKDLAEELGITKPRLYQIMSEVDPEGWRSAQASVALADLDETLDDMKNAADGLSLARARELHKSAQWKAERLARKLYGDTKQDDRGVSITVNVASLEDVCGTVTIEHEGPG